MENKLVKILAVDDIPDNLVTLKVLINDIFPEAMVFCANSGAEAFDMIAVDQPDIILLDIIMPGMDGFAVCKKLKEDRELCDIPVVFLTALKEDKKLRIKALEVGAESFLSKPIDEQDLTAQIRAMLKIRSANLLKNTEKVRLELMVANRTMELENELKERKRVEKELQVLNNELDLRVAQRTKELENAYHDLEAFSGSISHDLRAPLRAIGGFSQILQKEYKTVLGEEGSRLFQLVVDNANHMNRMIQGMMAISNVSSGSITIQGIDMTRLVESIYRELGTEEDRARITFTLQPLYPVWGDPTLLRQVWVNYLENAVKFSRNQEHPAITIQSIEENGQVVYSVQDNGSGFNPEYKEKLFLMFQRLHSSDEFEGTGIGLAIVERIIRRHSGKVWAEGAEGAGATFYFSLPKDLKDAQ